MSKIDPPLPRLTSCSMFKILQVPLGSQTSTASTLFPNDDSFTHDCYMISTADPMSQQKMVQPFTSLDSDYIPKTKNPYSEQQRLRENVEDIKVSRSVEVLSVVGKKPEQVNNATPHNTKRRVIAASALAITGVAAGIAIAVYLEMLAMGVAVAACYLVVATVYYCTPKSQVENGEVEKACNKERDVTLPA